ncbi:hypothetical protein DV711_08835 [Motiliproteus coralliicola]|uniref:Uncharacterized protein n=1 Tax=Motiliproteus coralliicola TaxID=2283196 RepID=A0A369WQ33_9GAMM|nr:hypothetical protein DV711_08835 [Motiliproteus coralliicola]
MESLITHLCRHCCSARIAFLVGTGCDCSTDKSDNWIKLGDQLLTDGSRASTRPCSATVEAIRLRRSWESGNKPYLVTNAGVIEWEEFKQWTSVPTLTQTETTKNP